MVIAGYGQKNRKISNNIFILGKISEEKKYSLYKNCLCYIHPSLYEGFGMPLVEAMLLKKKIITNTNGSIREITLNKAIYVKNPMDYKSWIRKINKFNYLKFPKINIKKSTKFIIIKIYLKATIKKFLMKIKILTILGTRPEIIKLSSFIKHSKNSFTNILVNTNQNYDKNLNDVFFRDLGIKKPKYLLKSNKKIQLLKIFLFLFLQLKRF